MDETLKESIKQFFTIYWEYKSGSTEDFILDLEEWLIDKGFDLSTVLQYKKSNKR